MAENFTSTPQWRRVRQVVLERDNHLCQIHGPTCTIKATAVDHIIAVADGGPVFDPFNLRASCQNCNSRRANTQKAQDGWRRSPTHIVLVVGPPGADKLSYVEAHRSPSDLVVDYDSMRAAFGDGVNAARNRLLTMLRRGELTVPRAWITSINPRAEAIFPYHEVVHVDADDPDWYAARQPPSRREW